MLSRSYYCGNNNQYSLDLAVAILVALVMAEKLSALDSSSGGSAECGFESRSWSLSKILYHNCLVLCTGLDIKPC